MVASCTVLRAVGHLLLGEGGFGFGVETPDPVAPQGIAAWAWAAVATRCAHARTPAARGLQQDNLFLAGHRLWGWTLRHGERCRRGADSVARLSRLLRPDAGGR